MMKRLMLSALLYLLAHGGVAAQALQVGRECSDFNLGTGKNGTAVKLSGFKGRLVLLQLWHPFCHASVNTIAVLDSLQKSFGAKWQVILVTAEPPQAVESALRTFRTALHPAWLSITNDTAITAAFPHLSVPHIVWIDTAGIIRAITNGEYLRPANLEAVYAGIRPAWPVKQETATWDYTRPLLRFAGGGLEAPQRVGYSTVTGILDGVTRKLVSDSGSSGRRLCLINFSIPELYRNTLKNNPHLRFENRFIVNVRDSSRLFFPGGNHYRTEWTKANFYCYESISPAAVTPAEQWSNMRQDLDRFFGLQSRVEKRQMTCLVLKHKKGRSFVPLTREETEKRNTTALSNLVYTLSATARWPPFINDTRLPPDTELPFSSENLKDLSRLKKVLEKSGLTLVREQRSIDVFVLTEK